MEPLLAIGLPCHRAIVAVDIERSTVRPDAVKAGLRNKYLRVVRRRAEGGRNP